MNTALLKIIFASSLVAVVLGHGYLTVPASRNSAWRFGFGTPEQYTDNQLNCGGFSNQWNYKNKGKCGVCGDPYDKKSPEYVFPGKYAMGVITKTYTRGQDIEVKVKLTSNHRGYFTFRIGELTKRPVSHEQLTHLLRQLDGSERYYLPKFDDRVFTVELRLPANLTCDQCVLQWTYTAGNNWGCDPDGTCGVGKGKKQETFVNCADVKILSSGNPGPPTDAPPEPPTEPPTRLPTRAPVITTSPPNPGGCKGAGEWDGNANMDAWCRDNCRKGFCPSSTCKCSP